MTMDKTFNAAKAEARLYADWESSGAFKAGANARPGAETFCIMIPPPNVTGSLHMGHAFNNTLQDILIRWHRMRGHDVLWQPGQDHAGIATQMVVERELAKDKSNPSRREMGREAFLSKVWEWKTQSGGTIVNQLKRLGASCDWSRNAFTMSGAPGAPAGEDGNFHDAVIKVFIELYNKGLIYRGKRLVNWDPHFETAISDLEVENIERPGHMWHFKYPLAGGETYLYQEKDADGNVTFEETRDYISIATTRPETMLGDGAVAVHPSDTRYAPIVGKLCEIPVGPKEHRRLIPIITDDYPDPDFGSGAVKITGAHDFNDYQVAKRGGIPMYRLMDTRAHMRDDGPDYATCAARAQEIANGAAFTEAEVDTLNLVPDELRGLDRFEARKRVVQQITEEGLAVMVPGDPEESEGNVCLDPGMVPYVEHKPIMQPFGDRSKVVIEPMLTDQWFVATDKIVEPALKAVRDGMAAQEAGIFDENSGTTRILPERDAKTYFHWLENIEPWCISRQLWWGHQIPVWYGLGIHRTHFIDDEGDGDLDEVELFRLLVDGAFTQRDLTQHCGPDFETVAAGFRHSLSHLPTPLQACRVVEVADKATAVEVLTHALARYEVDRDPTHLVYPVWRDPDVLDTWFSSGLWPIGTLGWPEETEAYAKYFPTDVLVTGFDIIFFWVARMMMMQLAVVDQVPFHTVYVHALVRDEKGKKMSKSVGNVIDPLELIDEYGADAVRFTLTAMAAMGRDLKLSTARVAGYRNFGTKLWNATRFAEMNGVFEGHTTAAIPSPEARVNRWIVGETARVRQTVDEALSNFRFNDAANALYAFVWGKVCDWYVEFAKPLFDDAKTAAETRQTMAWVLDQCFILLHPIMPFITEELWGLTGQRAKKLVHADWPAYGAERIDTEADREMNWVITLIEEIRSARAQMHVPVGLKLDMLQLTLDEAGRGAWARNEALIKRLARIESLTEAEKAPKGAITIAVEGGSFAIPLEGIIDVAEEKARLAKTLEKLEKDMGGLRGRLNNPKFVASAPDEVVEETRERLAQGDEEAGKLKAALARLAEVG
ncbi:valyl-tRNA synthetase [Defluviimonas sp. 20V17]|uniref:Valine--tRNA ligase n=1 Tax=Allgaiera indica TaxID=765699 RepID=A0AAN4UV77_9RHOB|nr:valine--tRNA ligase [Allgaiera indica]KDB04257.1 valyl-tRNA synthetase [Defluviimonas sp. 20V17]GHE06385.1 valine--tRNA ligase [Allgaiera indica]SDX91955.1 valyl-tRNA synthetase [Allgaiera indica]